MELMVVRRVHQFVGEVFVLIYIFRKDPFDMWCSKGVRFKVRLNIIAHLVLLCMVVVAPNAEALSCGQVTSGLAPCLPYLQGRGPLGGCCGGVKGLLGAAKTPADRKTTCTCLKSAANAIKGIDAGEAAGLPRACGVNIPYKISLSTDCSKIE